MLIQYVIILIFNFVSIVLSSKLENLAYDFQTEMWGTPSIPSKTYFFNSFYFFPMIARWVIYNGRRAHAFYPVPTEISASQNSTYVKKSRIR